MDERERLIRHQQAQVAGQSLYERVLQPAANTTQSLLPIPETITSYDAIVPVSTDYVPPDKRKVCCGIVSPVRRTFCLLVTFDLILTIVLWVIYAQGREIAGQKVAFLADEVGNYTFKTSLFDTVLCSGLRTIPLLLAYALFQLNNASVVAVTTFGTSVFIVVKIFLFDWPNHKDSLMTYIVIIETLVIAWVETWMLDFKVLPRERKAEAAEEYRRSLLGRQASWVHGPLNSHAPSEYYYSIPPSRDEPNDLREGIDVTQAFQSGVDSQSSLLLTHDPDAAGYVKKANEISDVVRQFIESTDWKFSSDQEGCCVTFKNVAKFGKVFKLEASLQTTVQRLFQVLIIQSSNAPNWNPTILESRVLQVLDYTTDICYNICADALGGVVKSRDFVDLRHWKNVDNGCILCVGCAVTHKNMPPQQKFVRGENRIVGWYMKPDPENSSNSRIVWVVSSDLKGWIPQSACDNALTSVMINVIKYLRIYLSDS